jgi:siroheme synthase
LPNEKQLVTNLGKLTEDVKNNNLENPAILIVGHAVTSTVSKLLSTINESEITA